MSGMLIETARWLAAEYTSKCFTGEPVELFPDEATEDRGWCYLFYYNTKRYLETLDPDDGLVPGTGPVVVVKASGDVWMLGSTGWGEDLAAYAGRHGIA